MKKKTIYSLVIIAAAFVSLLWAVGSSPSWRTQVYFALERDWKADWPFARGKVFYLRVRPMFEPFAPFRMEVEPGVNMLLDPEDYVSRTIINTGQWEPKSWSWVKQHLPVGGTFVDVGAHIGWYSLKAARVVGVTGHVIAVEPNPETVQKLRDNIKASGANDVITVQPVACSDSETMIDLFSAARRNTGATSVSRDNAAQAGNVHATYHVRARPLDDIIQETGVSRIDLMKIDVEGAELLVLKGAKQTLARHSPILIVEINEDKLQPMGTSAAEVKEFLRSQGYTPRDSSVSEINIMYAK